MWRPGASSLVQAVQVGSMGADRRSEGQGSGQGRDQVIWAVHPLKVWALSCNRKQACFDGSLNRSNMVSFIFLFCFSDFNMHTNHQGILLE